jgi:hypothetical protein
MSLFFRKEKEDIEEDIEEDWVSYRDGEALLVAKHRLDHLTTTDGKNREQRITQL